MDIHFISTLTPDDEDRYGPAIVATIKAMLETLPISYTLRIETTNGRVFRHARSEELEADTGGLGAARYASGPHRLGLA